MPRLIDFTDSQLASALHFLEAHEDALEDDELQAWNETKQTILHAAACAKESGQ